MAEEKLCYTIELYRTELSYIDVVAKTKEEATDIAQAEFDKGNIDWEKGETGMRIIEEDEV